MDTSLNTHIIDAPLYFEEINNILIMDRTGRVVYSTDRKQMNRSIKVIMPMIDLTAQSLLFYETEDVIKVTIPLFKGYGRNGTALLITRVN